MKLEDEATYIGDRSRAEFEECVPDHRDQFFRKNNMFLFVPAQAG